MSRTHRDERIMVGLLTRPEGTTKLEADHALGRELLRDELWEVGKAYGLGKQRMKRMGPNLARYWCRHDDDTDDLPEGFETISN